MGSSRLQRNAGGIKTNRPGPIKIKGQNQDEGKSFMIQVYTRFWAKN